MNSLYVLDDQVIKQVNDQTHVASRAVVEPSKVRQEMKKHARETEEAMPPIHHIRRDIRRQRKRAGNPLPVSQDKDFKNHQTLLALCHPKRFF